MRPPEVQAEIDQVKANPLAEAYEVRFLEAHDPLDALLHPNCPKEQWWQLAARYPLPALTSPAGQLHLLAEPDRWMQMEHYKVHNWIALHVERLDTFTMRRFAVDCAEHVWTAFDPWFFLSLSSEGKKQARRAIQVARLFAESHGRKTKKKQLIVAYDAVIDAIGSRSAGAPNSMLRAASLVATVDFEAKHAIWAAGAAADVIYHLADPESQAILHSVAEQVWQWRRLLQYVRGEVSW